MDVDLHKVLVSLHVEINEVYHRIFDNNTLPRIELKRKFTTLPPISEVFTKVRSSAEIYLQEPVISVECSALKVERVLLTITPCHKAFNSMKETP